MKFLPRWTKQAFRKIFSLIAARTALRIEMGSANNEWRADV
jgi:hypothetical protein